ncbi:hypothetical protein RND81_09G070700 [Saponaria officinalis]|uniref:SEC7 domain-containing protein n=1 Tax=Saponaria officinalis TaxID=3572 RepID=A0AAW1IJP9_SAPOF
MRELVRCIFSHLPQVQSSEYTSANGGYSMKSEIGSLDSEYNFPANQVYNGNGNFEYDGQLPAANFGSNAPMVVGAGALDDTGSGNGRDTTAYDLQVMTEPYGVPSMVEIFNFLCSLLNVVDHIGIGPRSNGSAYDEDAPLFALGLINSAIELGESSFLKHPSLLHLIQDEPFRNMMLFGLSPSPLILSMVCSIVLNLYHHLRMELKLQLEAFFSCVILRLAQQQEVAMEALVDFCRQKTFMVDMYANLDCDITCGNVFEDLANLLSKSAFPVNSPLSSMHILALDGLIAVIQGMAKRIDNGSLGLEQAPVSLGEYTPFWMVKCDSYSDPNHWVPFGLEFLQGTHLLPEKLDPQSVACFFRYTAGLHKNLTFDFQDMNLDTALRFCLETFILPGESQKIQRVMEAFSERYYEQSSHVLVDKDAAFILAYSLIMLNTNLHNVQVKKKLTEEDFIRNNRRINKGEDLPREYLLELYHSICKNGIRTTPEQKSAPYIVADSKAYLDHDMFAIMSGPTIAAISVVFDHVEHEEVYRACIDGFLAVAKISACHHLEDVLDDLVVSLCKFTTVLNPSSVEEPVLAFGDDTKAMMATVTVFTIANRYEDYIRIGCRNILDCILRLHKLGLLPTRVANDATDDSEISADPGHGKPLTNSLSAAHLPSMPTEQQLAAHQRTLQTIQKCHIDSIFTERAGSPAAGFCLELLIAITLNNRDIIVLLWQCVYEHIANIVQSTVMPCALVEKAVFENLADEILRSLQLVLKLDARVADAYFEQITQEVTRLVKANASHIRSQMGWRTITSLLSVTARHPDASEAGFDALVFIMSEGAHLLPSNFILCVDAARQFAESRVGEVDRSIRALDLMSGSVSCLVKWVHETKETVKEEDAIKMSQDIGEMWLRLVQALRKVCLDQREEVRNHGLSSLQRCLAEIDECFDMVIFTMLDDLLEIAQGHSQKDYRNMEGTLIISMKLLSMVFLQLLPELSQLTTFCKLWLGVLSWMEKYTKVKIRGKKSEKLHDLVQELLKNTLEEMKKRGVLAQPSALGGDSLWELTWLHVNNISPTLQSELFPPAGAIDETAPTPTEPLPANG